MTLTLTFSILGQTLATIHLKLDELPHTEVKALDVGVKKMSKFWVRHMTS